MDIMNITLLQILFLNILFLYTSIWKFIYEIALFVQAHWET